MDEMNVCPVFLMRRPVRQQADNGMTKGTAGPGPYQEEMSALLLAVIGTLEARQRWLAIAFTPCRTSRGSEGSR